MSKQEHRLVEEFLTGQMSRRELIRGLMAAGLSVSAIGGLLASTGISDRAEAESLVEAQHATVKKGGTPVFTTLAPASDVDPVTLFSEGGVFTGQICLEYLCFPRKNYTLEPKLATSWHSKQPNQWTFNLRQGVKWHDGTHFTADDVVATFDRLTDPKVNSAALSAFKGILSKGHTRKNSSHQVTFHLDRPYVDFPYLVSAFTYNSFILPKNYKIGDFVKGKIGTGPFVLTKYTSKVGATYVANKHYWAKGLPHVDGINLKYYSDNTAQVLALQSGAADVLLDMPYQGSQAVFSSSDINVLSIPSSAYRGFHMRVDQKPFNDKRVRQAVAYCMDRGALVQGLWHGFASQANDHPFAPIFPTSVLPIAHLPQRHQNYPMAKKLLAEAGHPNGFKATITTESFLEIPQYAVFIQQQLKLAGIDITLNVEPQPTYFGTGANQPWLDVPVGIVDWAPRGTASQLIGPAYLCKGIWNSAHWCNASFNKYLAEYDSELNLGKRKKIALQAAKVMYDETPEIIAYWIKELRAMRKHVHGMAVSSFALVDPTKIYLS